MERVIRRRRLKMPSGTRSVHAAVVLAALLLSAGAPVGARAECGDADGDGSVTVTDGVQALRAAAGLSSTCGSGCDVDVASVGARCRPPPWSANICSCTTSRPEQTGRASSPWPQRQPHPR